MQEQKNGLDYGSDNEPVGIQAEQDGEWVDYGSDIQTEVSGVNQRETVDPTLYKPADPQGDYSYFTGAQPEGATDLAPAGCEEDIYSKQGAVVLDRCTAQVKGLTLLVEYIVMTGQRPCYVIKGGLFSLKVRQKGFLPLHIRLKRVMKKVYKCARLIREGIQ